MKIPKQLPQFTGEKMLIAVTGRQEAVFYLAADGVIVRYHEFKIATPEYTDREGFFEKRGKTVGVFGSGSVYENKKLYIIGQFFNRLGEEIHRVEQKEDITGLYIFTPKHLRAMAKTSLPRGLWKKLTQILEGNFTKSHPNELLAKIKRGKERAGEPAVRVRTPPAPSSTPLQRNRLLNKANKAGKIIKQAPKNKKLKHTTSSKQK